MSFRAVTWAFDVIRGLGGTEKLVLLALAEFANDDDETWRSSQELAARVECSPRTLKTHLKTLEQRGLLEREPRYAVCRDVGGPCAGRTRHAHRSGTTYRLRLDRSEPLALETTEVQREGNVAGEGATRSQRESARVVSVASESRGRVTGAKVAPVAFAPESSGNPHRCNSCTCEGNADATGATSRMPQVQRVAPVLSINPQLNPQPTNQPVEAHQLQSDSRSVGLVEDSDSAAVAAPDGATPQEDLVLVHACLPEGMRVLDAGGLGLVAALLRERLDAGWEAKDIRRVMDQPVPQAVERMASLVAYRLRKNVDPHLAPIPQQGSAAVPQAQAAEPVVPAHELVWRTHVWEPEFERARAGRGDSPAEIIAASKETSRVLEQRGLAWETWPGYWAEAVLGADLDPEDETSFEALAHAAQELALGRMEEAS